MWLNNTTKPIIALAPMADYTDGPFCKICRQVAGSDFVIWREMVSSEALVRDSQKTLAMCEFTSDERPVIIQLFGSDPLVVARAVDTVVKRYQPDGVDINMGCPVPKIAGKARAGAALLKDHDRAVEMIRQIKKFNPDVFLSVKTRLGWSRPDEILEFAPKLVAAGIDMLTIHGRTKVQGYSGSVDWGMIGKVKSKIGIPLLANGDVLSYQDMEHCLQVTGADGVMIGRGALGNPWILGGRHQDLSKISLEQKVNIILKHAVCHLERYGEERFTTFRKHLVWYFKDRNASATIKNVKKIRQALVKTENLSQLEEVLYSL